MLACRTSARLHTSRSPKRRPSDLQGQIWMSDDFDEPDEEIERLFGTRD
jgi:hypothetical protein